MGSDGGQAQVESLIAILPDTADFMGLPRQQSISQMIFLQHPMSSEQKRVPEAADPVLRQKHY